MTLRPLLAATLFLALTPALGAGAPRKEASEAPRAALAVLAEDYWENEMRLSPISATFVGHPAYQDRLDDNSEQGREDARQSRTVLLLRLKGVDRALLSETDRVTWDVLKLDLERDIEGDRYKFWQWNVDHMDGPQTWIGTVIGLAQPMKSDADAEILLRRMKGMPGYFAAHAANLREGLGENRIAARVPVEKAISQIEDILKTAPDKNTFADAARKLPKPVQKEYLPRVLAAVESHVYPAYRIYLRFLKDEYLPRSRADAIGLSALPGGLDAYRYMIRYHTTVDKTPQELHDLGLEEIKSLNEEMSAIASRLGHKGDLKSFLEAVRRDPKNFFSTREQVLEDARDQVARATAQLPRFFGTLPKTPLEVRPIEEYKEKNDVAARYYEPDDSLTRPGIYFINTYKPETRARFAMTSLAAHEGVPGHHLQIAIAMEKRDLPAFRRHASFNAFVEGWALYSERLAEEMGLYRDDLSRVGMLTDQTWRACRLVVDTGIHAFGWSRRRAIDFMKENTAKSEAEIVAEVDRYTIWPGQALSYKVGQREIMALRREDEKREGAAFSLSRFHDEVLKNGPVPLSVLRAILLGPAAATP